MMPSLASAQSESTKPAAKTRPGLFGVRTSIAVVAGCALLPVLYFGAGYFVPIVAAFVAALIMGPVQGRLVARGFSGGLAAGVQVLSLLVVLISLIGLTAGSFASWANDLPRIGNALATLIDDVRRLALRLQSAGQAVEEAMGVDPVESGSQLGAIFSNGVGLVAVQTPIFLGQLVVFFALLFFFLESRMRLRAGVLRLCMTRETRLRAAHVFRDAEQQVSTYLITVTAINAVLGIATALAMWALGLPNPVLWGVLAFALNYAPYLGPSVLIVLLVGAGLVSFDEPGKALLPALAFFSLNALEANFFTPTIVGSQVKLEPAVLIIALVLLFGLWGIAGAVMAVPLLLILQAVLNHTVLRATLTKARATR
ncbi:MAG: AI-2E family transporter [Hyphomicrobiales bacterium]